MQSPGAAMDDPDMVLLIHPQSDGPAQQPVIGQRLGPQRIDFEHRRLNRAALRIGLVLEHGLADAERGDHRNQCSTYIHVAFVREAFHDRPLSSASGTAKGARVADWQLRVRFPREPSIWESVYAHSFSLVMRRNIPLL